MYAKIRNIFKTIKHIVNVSIYTINTTILLIKYVHVYWLKHTFNISHPTMNNMYNLQFHMAKRPPYRLLKLLESS